jgi:hypothetical protein
MSYYYLFCNEDRHPLARIRYTFSPDNALIIEDMIPAGAVTIGKVETLELQRNAAQLDKDEAESREPDWDAHYTAERLKSKAEYVRPIRWGVKG